MSLQKRFQLIVRCFKGISFWRFFRLTGLGLDSQIAFLIVIRYVHYSMQYQSYEIKSSPWTILWFRILGIFSVENIDRLVAMMFQTSDNSQLCIDSQYSSQQLTIVWNLIHHSTQPILIFSRARVLHLDRLKEETWLHSFAYTNV